MTHTERQHDSGLVLLSGGLDSGVILSVAQAQCAEVDGIFFDYGQKTLERERRCVGELRQHFNLRFLREIDLHFIGELTGAALCRPDQRVDKSNEYVPFRNGIFLSIATAMAEANGSEVLYIGSTGEDRICRDNSPQFRAHFQGAVDEGINHGSKIKIAAPLENLSKAEVVKLGLRLGTPFERTWSCHNNVDRPCMSCSNCVARDAAFKDCGILDPVI